MSNLEKAYEMILRHISRDCEGCYSTLGPCSACEDDAKDAAKAIAAAGLITPDLPKEDVVSANGTPVWRPDKGLMVTAFRDGEVRMGIPPTYPDTEFREVIYTQPQAIEQALALLAAANHKEEA